MPCTGRGVSAPDTSKILRLLRSLLSDEAGVHAGTKLSGEPITFWDWARGFDWALHTLRVHGIDV
jgi:hypothetical protein